MTLDETTQVMRLLGAAFPNTKVTESTIVAYHAGLGDADADTIRESAVALIRSSRFFPSIAELRSNAGLIDPKTLGPDDPAQFAEQRRLARGTLEVFGPERTRHILGADRYELLLGEDPEAANALTAAIAAELGDGE